MPDLDSVGLAKKSSMVTLAALTISLVATMRARVVPPAGQMVPAMMAEPQQVAATEKPIYRHINGSDYQIIPKYTYKLTGLVVATHDSKSWLDISHAKWGDELNTADLCVVWGANAAASLLDKVSITHGDWTCYFQTSDRATYGRFQANQISNNHMLPANAEIARAIAGAEIGDQIEFTGFLVDYSINNGPQRATSITRDDTGNGACEIVFTTGYRLLKRTAAGWIGLRKVTRVIALLAFLTALASIFVLPFFTPPDRA